MHVAFTPITVAFVVYLFSLFYSLFFYYVAFQIASTVHVIIALT